mgnify:CR=1 FL=1
MEKLGYEAICWITERTRCLEWIANDFTQNKETILRKGVEYSYRI